MRWRRYRRRNGEVRAAASGSLAAGRARDDYTTKRGGRRGGHTKAHGARQGGAALLSAQQSWGIASSLLCCSFTRAAVRALVEWSTHSSPAGRYAACGKASWVHAAPRLCRSTDICGGSSRPSFAEPAVCLLSAAVAQQSPIAALPIAQGNRR
jgi:hypothetical protein